MTPPGIVAEDRRDAAVYQAARIVAGRHYGAIIGSGRIWRISEPRIERSCWAGGVTITKPPPTAHGRLCLATAGITAQFAWNLEPWNFAWDVIEWLSDPENDTDADWELAGVEPGKPTEAMAEAALDVQDLLWRPGGKLWSAVNREARRIIIASRRST